MKPRKPDRFERTVRELSTDPWGGDTWKLAPQAAIKLLREEHAWMRRMVRGMVADYEQMAVQAVKNGYDLDNKYMMKVEACKTVLYQLEQRRK